MGEGCQDYEQLDETALVHRGEGAGATGGCPQMTQGAEERGRGPSLGLQAVGGSGRGLGGWAGGGGGREGARLAATGVSQRTVSPDWSGDRKLTPGEVITIPRQHRLTSLLLLAPASATTVPPHPLACTRGPRTGCRWVESSLWWFLVWGQ